MSRFWLARRPLVVTVHGHSGNAFAQYRLWRPYAASLHLGLVAVEWQTRWGPGARFLGAERAILSGAARGPGQADRRGAQPLASRDVPSLVFGHARPSWRTIASSICLWRTHRNRRSVEMTAISIGPPHI